MRSFKVSKGATVYTVTFIVYFLLVFFSAGAENNIPTIIFMSSYGGFVVASIIYAVYKLCAFISNLVKNKHA